MRKYARKDGLTAVSGVLKNISKDKMSATIVFQQYDRDAKQRVYDSVQINAPEPLEDYENDQYVAVSGYPTKGGISVETMTNNAGYVAIDDTTSYLAGEVMFASKNEEVDQDGNKRLNKAGEPKKPHFDVAVATGSGKDRVTHMVKFYNFERDGQLVDNIGRYEKLFKDYSHKESPVYFSGVINSSNDYETARDKTIVGDDGKEHTFQNAYNYHLGATAPDFDFLKGNIVRIAMENDVKDLVGKGVGEFVKKKDAPKKEAPAPNKEESVEPEEVDDLDVDFIDNEI